MASEIKRIVSKRLTKPLPIYSHCVIYQGLAYISAIQGFIPGSFDFPSGGLAAEAAQMMENLATVVDEIGTSFDRIIKMTLFLTDMADFPVVNDIVNQYIADSPSRSSLGVATLPRKARVVIECVFAVEE